MKKHLATIRRIVQAAIPFGLVFLAVALLIFIAWYPKYELSSFTFNNQTEYVEALNATRTTWAQIIGGIGLFGTILFSWLSYRLTQSGQVAERYSKAVELLGSTHEEKDGTRRPNVEARLGAIYALERVAWDSPTTHWAVINLLVTYLRTNFRSEFSDLQHFRQQSGEKAAAGEEVFAIAGVLARRKQGREEGWLLLSNTNLRWVSLSGAKLKGAALWHSDLNTATLDNADLTDARLQNANLYRATLANANLTNVDLTDAILDGADLQGAKLKGAIMKGASTQGTIFADVDLSDVEGLTWEQLEAAAVYEKNKLPIYLNSKLSLHGS